MAIAERQASVVRALCQASEVMDRDSVRVLDTVLSIAIVAADVANYCDHVEHNEIADLQSVRRAGSTLRVVGVTICEADSVDPVEAYANRLEMIESRNVVWHPDSFDGPSAARAAQTWRALQLVQAAHDRAYHSDVLGLAKLEQLRHYALHLAKLAGATAAVYRGELEPQDWLSRRVPDMILFGIKLSTVSGERLLEEPVLACASQRRVAAPAEFTMSHH
jgi:hypothetical protein